MAAKRTSILSLGDPIFIGFVCLVVAAIAGWVMNIIAIANAGAVTPFVLLRIVGVIVAPLGAALGYF